MVDEKVYIVRSSSSLDNQHEYTRIFLSIAMMETWNIIGDTLRK